MKKAILIISVLFYIGCKKETTQPDVTPPITKNNFIGHYVLINRDDTTASDYFDVLTDTTMTIPCFNPCGIKDTMNYTSGYEIMHYFGYNICNDYERLNGSVQQNNSNSDTLLVYVWIFYFKGINGGKEILCSNYYVKQ